MQAPVNIVYPVDGGTYPIVDPGPGGRVSSAYLTFSFGVTCPGGGQAVKWGVDNDTLGEARYYDQFSAQFVMKIAGGTHQFWVKTDCGQGEVKFLVG